MPNFYPFDSAELMKKQRSIKRRLLSDNTKRIQKKIAVLGGSTTDGIVDMLDIFLLEQGIQAEFYQSLGSLSRILSLYTPLTEI